MTEHVSRRAVLVVGLSAVTRLGGPVVGAPVPKAGDNKSWVGKTVLPKKPDPSAEFKDRSATLPPAKTDRPVVTRLEGASWEVKSEQGTRVEVVEAGNAFWVEKGELVLLSEAIDFYTKAIKADELDAYMYNLRGWAAYLLGKPTDAIKDFDKFLELVPAAATGHRVVGLSNRGLVLAETGKFDAAVRDLDEAVKLNHPPALLNRGWVCELKGDYRKAEADYAAALKNHPRDPLALNNMAWLKATCPDAAVRDGKEAVKLAQQVCERTDNREGMFLDTLAAAHAEAGDFAAAVKAQERALEDTGYARKEGEGAQKRLQLYKDKKPYRSEPRK
ncbi:MAG: tetratricopeptide repeat protein [Planctomycetes bacterium]|nr:tetratricopeptide repeat protein [Planctomycetota bacterium]